MARKRTYSSRSQQPLVIRGPLAFLLLLVLVALVASMALDRPANLWNQPGLAEVRGSVLQALGLPTPQPPQAGMLGQESASPGPWYQVYFTNPRYPDKESDHHDGIDAHLVQLIGQAQRSVDVAAYELDLETVAHALLAAKQRGVTVRLVTDTDYIDEKAVQQIRQGGIPVVGDQRGALMHNKFVVVDGRYVWTGSWNLTTNCTYRNNNNAILITSEALARNYEAEFAEMFEKHQFGPNSPSNTPSPVITIDGTRVENYFAPEDHVSEHIASLLRQAQKSIRFLAFSFTDDGLGRILSERAKAGVAVSGVMEKRGSDSESSQYQPLRRAGVDVLLDGNPYVMHHKVFVIDEAIVITGSFNFTSNADRDNDENLLIIYNRDIARLYLQEFERVRQRAAEAKT